VRKPNLLYVFLYLIAGISFGFIFVTFVFFVLFRFLGRSVNVVYGIPVGFDDNFAEDIILLFILISIMLFPLSIYLSRFYGKAKVFLIAVIMAAILTGVLVFYNIAKNSGVVQVKTVPVNKVY